MNRIGQKAAEALPPLRVVYSNLELPEVQSGPEYDEENPPPCDSAPSGFVGASAGQVAWASVQTGTRDGIAHGAGSAASLGLRHLVATAVENLYSKDPTVLAGVSTVVGVVATIGAAGLAGYRMGELVGVRMAVPDGYKMCLFKVAGSVIGAGIPVGSALLIPCMKGLYGSEFEAEALKIILGAGCRMVGHLTRDVIQQSVSVGTISVVDANGEALDPDAQRAHDAGRLRKQAGEYLFVNELHQLYSKDAVMLYQPGVGSSLSSVGAESTDGAAGPIFEAVQTMGTENKLKYTPGKGLSLPVNKILTSAASRAVANSAPEFLSLASDVPAVGEGGKYGLRLAAGLAGTALNWRGNQVGRSLKAEIKREEDEDRRNRPHTLQQLELHKMPAELRVPHGGIATGNTTGRPAPLPEVLEVDLELGQGLANVDGQIQRTPALGSDEAFERKHD